ncbi:MAG: PAS domain S-box protein [Candidatus Methanoperedens sp.]
MSNNSQKGLADSRLIVDMVENILRFSDNPGSCAGYLTKQIRELIGVRIVAIIEFVTDESGISHKLIGICPPRKEPYWGKLEIQDFVSRVSNYEKACLIDPVTDPDGKPLSTLDIGKSFVSPLNVGPERVGMIILLDLMESKGASTILEMVDKISGVFALILKNSLLYRNLENTVEIRTRQLAQREKQFRALFEQAAAGVAQVDIMSGKFLNLNKKYCDIVGYTKEEMLNKDFQSITYPDDLKTSLGNMELLKSGKIREFSMEKRYIRKNGDIIWVNLTISPMWNPGEPPDYNIAVVQDITERMQAEEKLRESESRLKKSQEIAHVGSWALDVSTNRLTWSDEAYRIFGLQPAEFNPSYEVFLDLVHPDDRIMVDAAYSGSIREGRDTYDIEHRIVRRHTGEIRHVHERCEHIKDTSGAIIRSAGMVQDITERKKAEEELRKHRVHLEELVKGRTAELNQKNDELERFNRLFVGREIRMIELKKQIAELEKKIASSEDKKNDFK